MLPTNMALCTIATMLLLSSKMNIQRVEIAKQKLANQPSDSTDLLLNIFQYVRRKQKPLERI
jgi:hypothetical protein